MRGLSVTPPVRAALLLGLIAIGLVIGADAMAQGAFGVARPDTQAAGPNSGVFLWIAQEQSRFYRALSQAIRDIRSDGGALWLLVGLSFLYGVFHAAGPGHGKAIISSYIVSTGETLRRGLLLSSAAAILQALVAIAAVLLLTILFRATSVTMAAATFRLEAVSYLVMLGLGFWLVYRKGRAVFAPDGGTAHPDDCGCAVPSPAELGGTWRGAAGAVVAVGIRPCTGALVVLVFAFAQGLLWAGILATFAMAIGTALTVGVIAALAVGAKATALRLAGHLPAGGSRLVAGLELLAALCILALAGLLLGGLVAGGGTPG